MLPSVRTLGAAMAALLLLLATSGHASRALDPQLASTSGGEATGLASVPGATGGLFRRRGRILGDPEIWQGGVGPANASQATGAADAAAAAKGGDDDEPDRQTIAQARASSCCRRGLLCVSCTRLSAHNLSWPQLAA